MMGNEAVICDITTLKEGDIIHYYNRDNGKFLIDKGTIKEEGLHSDGVDVYGEGWTQYVSKWFICKVERDDRVFFEQ